MRKYCDTCALYIPAARACQIMHPSLAGKIGVTDFCSQHRTKLYTCESCGAKIFDVFIKTEDDGVHIYCDNCIKKL